MISKKNIKFVKSLKIFYLKTLIPRGRKIEAVLQFAKKNKSHTVSVVNQALVTKN